MTRRNRLVWIGVSVAVALCASLAICGLLAIVLNLDDVRRAIGDLVTVTPTATAWPQPVCTPPACREDEVYHCPDVCPGGCGTVCVTATPAP